MTPRAWLCSVPDHERTLAAPHLRDFDIDARPFAADHVPPNARVVSVAYTDRLVSTDLIDAEPDVRTVITRSDGFDHLPVAALARAGVACYHLGDYAAPAVARFALAQALALVRRIPEAAARTRQQSWARTDLVSRDLPEVCVGVLGTGRIGARFARLAHAVGAGEVIAHDVAPDPALAAGSHVRYVDLPTLLAKSDVLSLHVPLTPATRDLIDAAALSSLPRGAVLINTARGEIVNQDAVAAAIASGRLAAYAADVLPGEPTPHDDLARFAADPRVVLTPHVAAYDAGTIARRYARTAHIVRAVLTDQAEQVARWRLDAKA